MKRRNFIVLTGLGAAGASVLGACGHPENKLIPALIPDDEYVPGLDYLKATTCGMCSAGCGIVVRTREHKANKIEGNPPHPTNQGALCARGQAGLQMLYNPDRIKSPMRRKGGREHNEFEEISWDDAIASLAAKLREIKTQGREGSVIFALGDSRGATGLAVEHLMSAFGSGRLLDGRLLSDARVCAGYEAVYQRPCVPFFDIANARYVLSFGARFIESWHSPVMYSIAYGKFRQASPRGKLVQIEPRMSLTGANADQWVPAAIGAEGLVALAIAQVIVREGLDKAPHQVSEVPDLGASTDIPSSDLGSGSLAAKLERYAPEATADLTGIPAETLIDIAREFATSLPAVAIGWGSGLATRASIHEAAVQNLKAIHLLNNLLGNQGKPGGVFLPDGEALDPFAKLRGNKPGHWQPVTKRTLAAEGTAALLFHGVNPAYSEPWTAEVIKRIPLVVSFSSFFDETTLLADLILPDHTFLESWDLHATHSVRNRLVVSLTQPVVKPEFNTMQTADALVAVGRQLDLPLAIASAEEITKQAAGGLSKFRGSISAEGSDEFWTAFSEQGVWIENEPSRTGSDGTDSSAHISARDSAVGGDDSGREEPKNAAEYPYQLLAYEHPALGMGENANLPWLQELPDPMTAVIWGSWVEINPRTARSLGIADGDLVMVSTAEGQVTAPAVLYPAIRPEVLGMPYGQGHEAHGRFAKGLGVNVARVSPFTPNPRGAAIAVQAQLTKVSGEGRLVRFGTSLPERPEIKR